MGCFGEKWVFSSSWELLFLRDLPLRRADSTGLLAELYLGHAAFQLHAWDKEQVRALDAATVHVLGCVLAPGGPERTEVAQLHRLAVGGELGDELEEALQHGRHVDGADGGAERDVAAEHAQVVALGGNGLRIEFLGGIGPLWIVLGNRLVF